MQPDVLPPSLSPLQSQSSRESNVESLPVNEAPGPSIPRMQRSESSFEPQLHEFTNDGSSKHPWATLRLRSSAPSSKSLPIFFEGQKIRGEVELCLRKPDSIKSIAISVRMKNAVVHFMCSHEIMQIEGIATVGLEERIFLQHSEMIWQEELGNPRVPAELNRTKSSGKLVGTYQWPFSLSLPPKITASDKVARDLGLNSEERLPPNMQNSGWDSAICYRLALTIKRHGMFRPDSM